MTASMGVKGALEGRKVLVLTIDPAKRLANSLGLKQFGNNETKIPNPKRSMGKIHVWRPEIKGSIVAEGGFVARNSTDVPNSHIAGPY